MNKEFLDVIKSMRPSEQRTVALAAADDVDALRALCVARDMGFVNAFLCGDENKIKKLAHENDLDISDFEIVHCDSDIDAARVAVSLVRTGRADILMKGLIHSSDILRAVLNRESGIRGDGVLSHVSVLYSPLLKRRLFLTDIAMVMYPDLQTKSMLIRNAVGLAQSFGVTVPRVAPLCAVEVLNPAMPATVDADALHQMNLRGEIANCIVSGPISFDIAVSRAAAVKKGVPGPIMGDADILLFDDIEAGNNTIKAMVQYGGWIFGGVVIGARAPIVLNSRSDSDVSKLFSIACACGI